MTDISDRVETRPPPVLRRETGAPARREDLLRLYLITTAIAFTVVGLLAGLGLSWMVASTAQVTVIREAPRVSSWCLRAEPATENRGEMLLLGGGERLLLGDTEPLAGASGSPEKAGDEPGDGTGSEPAPEPASPEKAGDEPGDGTGSEPAPEPAPAPAPAN